MIDPEGDRTIIVYTDGSCYPNPNGIGAWAFYCSYKGKQAVRYGSRIDGKDGKWEGQTNNRAELCAILMVLKFLPSEAIHDQPILIFTDSEYCKNAINEWGPGWQKNNWKTSTGKPAANRELIEPILELVAKHRRHRDLEVRWVRGHTGVPENELCDQNANYARKTGKTNWKPKKDFRTKI